MLSIVDLSVEGVQVIVSQRALEAIGGRTILDDEFRTALFAEPDVALAANELTDMEETEIRSDDAESLDACATILRRHHAGRQTKRAHQVCAQF